MLIVFPSCCSRFPFPHFTLEPQQTFNSLFTRFVSNIVKLECFLVRMSLRCSCGWGILIAFAFFNDKAYIHMYSKRIRRLSVHVKSWKYIETPWPRSLTLARWLQVQFKLNQVLRPLLHIKEKQQQYSSSLLRKRKQHWSGLCTVYHLLTTQGIVDNMRKLYAKNLVVSTAARKAKRCAKRQTIFRMLFIQLRDGENGLFGIGTLHLSLTAA